MWPPWASVETSAVRRLRGRASGISSFDTRARWRPVTQSARSRRSYGKQGIVNSLDSSSDGCKRKELAIFPSDMTQRNSKTSTQQSYTKENRKYKKENLRRFFHVPSYILRKRAKVRIYRASSGRSRKIDFLYFLSIDNF